MGARLLGVKVERGVAFGVEVVWGFLPWLVMLRLGDGHPLWPRGISTDLSG